MKSWCLFFPILLLFTSHLWASWNNVTDSSFIVGSRVSIGSQNEKKVFVELRVGKPTLLNLEKKGSTRWRIHAEAKGILTISLGSSQVQAKILAKGENDLKIFLESGKYEITTTIGARAECFLWKKRKLSSLVPDGGGFATYMQAGDVQFAYYRATIDTVPVLSVKGPTMAFVFFRADMPKGAQKISADVAVKENDSTVIHKISDLVKSLKAEPSEDSNKVISEAMVLKISVPDGSHKYSVHLNKCSGFVKFYRTDKKKKGKAGDSPTPGESMTESDLDENLAVTDLEANDEFAKVDKEKSHRYHLSMRVGGLFDNNVYRYSPGYLDTFELGLKSYRYPGVKKTSDILIPLETRASANFGKMSASAAISWNTYLSNSELSNLGYNFSLGWTGPIKLRAVYRLSPYDPVRPTYFALKSYKLMTYSENKGSLSAQWNRWDIKPGVDFSFGYFDYNTIFDMYDAPFWESGISITRSKPLGFRIDGQIGSIFAKKNTGQDWSNGYYGLGIEGHFPMQKFLLGAKGTMKFRNYGTTVNFDTHFQRQDLSGENFAYLKYSHAQLGVTTRFGYLWRNTTSPLRVINDEKDYKAMTAAVEFAWDLAV